MKTAILRNRRWLVIPLTLVVLSTVAAGVYWNRSTRIQARPPIGDVATILVAPFAASGNPAEPWSGTGLAEEVRLALGTDSSVVIRRPDHKDGAVLVSTPYADGAKEIDAARRIGADYVLTGTIGRKERGSEIGLRLIRVGDASLAWTGTFWRSPADFGSFAGDLAAAVTEAIRAERDREAREREPQYRPAEQMPH